MRFDDFWIKDDDGNYTHERYFLLRISEEEHKRFYSTFEFPIIALTGGHNWFDESGGYHRVDGPAYFATDIGFANYWFNGVFLSKTDWTLEVRKMQRSVYFLREKIICLQKLTEIPELYQEVYYANKEQFMALLRKV